MRKLCVMSLAALLVMASAMPTFAIGEGLEKDDGGYYFEKDNGERARNEWVYVEYEGKGYWYYMTDYGYPLRSAITPDGYKVNSNGHWIDEGNLSSDSYEYDEDYMLFISNAVFDNFYDNNPISSGLNKKRENFSSADKALITYAYVYFKKDSRISEKRSGRYDLYNVVSKDNLMSIMKDLTGSSNETDMQEFAKYGTLKGGSYWVQAGGSFGAAGDSYLSDKNIQLSIEGNRVKITGDVLRYQANSGYVPIKKYNAYFTISDAPQLGFLRFDELNIQ